MEQKPIDQDKVLQAQTELDAHQAQTKDKVYAVVSNDLHLELLINFFEKEVRWTGMEALGVTQISQKLEKVKKEGFVNGCFYLKNIELDAISFFHSSAFGKGNGPAQNFITMIKPFNEPIKEAKADVAKLHELEMKLAAVENGIDVEAPVEKDPIVEFDEQNDEQN